MFVHDGQRAGRVHEGHIAQIGVGEQILQVVDPLGPAQGLDVVALQAVDECTIDSWSRPPRQYGAQALGVGGGAVPETVDRCRGSVTPTLATSSPRSALTKVLLPAFMRPTTASTQGLLTCPARRSSSFASSAGTPASRRMAAPFQIADQVFLT